MCVPERRGTSKVSLKARSTGGVSNNYKPLISEFRANETKAAIDRASQQHVLINAAEHSGPLEALAFKKYRDFNAPSKVRQQISIPNGVKSEDKAEPKPFFLRFMIRRRPAGR